MDEGRRHTAANFIVRCRFYGIPLQSTFQTPALSKIHLLGIPAGHPTMLRPPPSEDFTEDAMTKSELAKTLKEKARLASNAQDEAIYAGFSAFWSMP
jgi:hypothetical protein